MTLTKKNSNSHLRLFPFGTRDLFSNRFFGSGLMGDLDQWDGGQRTPLANISETDKEFRVDLSVPGMKREDFKVEVDDGMLTVSCENEQESKEEKENYMRREFSYESFTRTFQLPENASEDKINAKYEDGMLKISIPKKEIGTAKNKKSIQVG